MRPLLVWFMPGGLSGPELVSAVRAGRKPEGGARATGCAANFVRQPGPDAGHRSVTCVCAHSDYGARDVVSRDSLLARAVQYFAADQDSLLYRGGVGDIANRRVDMAGVVLVVPEMRITGQMVGREGVKGLRYR